MHREAWETPWFAVIPMVVGGLCLAGVVGLLARAVRRHRDTRRTSTPPEADQPDTAQTQATHRTP